MANQVAINQKDVTTQILTRIDEMQSEGLALPKNYNPSNALQIAFLKIQEMKVRNQPVLEIVTKKSVVESLLNMTLQGLSPAKNQCYFIPYGNQLQMQRSYFGTQTALKRLNGVNDIWANVIYEGDDFQMEIDDKGVERFVKHDTNWLNKDNDILGAYAIIDTEDQGQLLTVMTQKEIKASWSQAKTQNVHNKFGQEMAKRTVINRAAKNYINTSDDSDLLIHAINDTTENEYDEEKRARDVTGTANEEKAQDLLSEFKATNGKEEPEEQGFSQEQIDVLNAMSQEHEDTEDDETEYADYEEINEDFNELTIPQIQKRLDDLDARYDRNARKEELVGILEMATSGGVQDELF